MNFFAKRVVRASLFGGVILLWGGSNLFAATPLDEVALWISSDLREIHSEQDELVAELLASPAPALVTPSLRLGFHSRTFFDQGESDSLVIDLGKSWPLNLVTMVPVKVESPFYGGQDYGFPLRFSIEAAETKDFSNPSVIADKSEADYPAPKGLPVTFEANGVKARYLRITSTKHFPILEHFIWALGEVCVISGNRNVAVSAKVISGSSSRIPPTWSPENLLDGHHIAAIPAVAETSPSNGWLSIQETNPNQTKWVEVDWGKISAIDEIRFVPARPTDMADVAGMGFPLKYRVEVFSRASSDGVIVAESEQSSDDFVSDNLVVIPTPGIKGSRVRLTAEYLWRRKERASFALAELQVISGEQNLALGQSVSASDSFQNSQFPRWAPEFLVDGFSSRHRLTDWPAYLRGIENYRRLTRELDELEAHRGEVLSRVTRRLAVGASLFLLAVILVPSLLLIRSIRRRKQETKRLREQIARDLHDDIGSNLGGISLLSEVDELRTDLPEEVREDLAEIHAIASASSESMRDIIWLIQDGECPVADLILRFKETAHRMPGDLSIQLEVSPEVIPDLYVSLRSRRHLLFAFKETLHNVTRHAEAGKVAILLTIDSKARTLQFRVEDDGRGFDPKTQFTGNGLGNLKRRSEQLGGNFQIESSPDRGTVVSFIAPVNSR